MDLLLFVFLQDDSDLFITIFEGRLLGLETIVKKPLQFLFPTKFGLEYLTGKLVVECEFL